MIFLFPVLLNTIIEYAMVLLDHMPCEEGSGCLLQVPYPLREQVL